ncbi:MAG TPA: molybdopterin-dependent oxidoreductase [Bryobacterales bacterium]|nr:molybdopterin-dependent oxidoreductase [Bryobacterales bacterium]
MRQTLHTVCSHDCPDACAIQVEVENGRAVKIRGDADHPVTRGFLCGKVARYLERVYSPERLLYPMRRVGAKGEGRFERITWDEALGAIARRLAAIAAEFGPESILPYSYGGTMGYLNGASMDRRFFHRLGASLLARTICSEAGAVGLASTQGVRVGTEPEQFRHARLILAWGANILGTNVHLWPFIVEARRNGAKFYVIDPHLNRTGRQADWHLPIAPGTDTALALGMMHVIIGEGLCDAGYVARYTLGFDELRERVKQYPPQEVAGLTGLAADDIVRLAREYATVRPAAIRLNYGLQRSERGGMAVRTIAMLPAITGSWREVGGGLQLSTSHAFRLRRDKLEMAELCRQSPLGRAPRTINMVELGKALLDLDSPPVKALFVYNANPATVCPDQNRVLRGLAREDLFTVVSEQFQTDTADYADILLPATTFLEHTDLYFAYGHYHLQLARPAIAPLGEALPNVELFRRLAQRMGFTDPCFDDSDDDMIRAALSSEHRWVKGITLEDLEREHSVRLNVSPPGEPFLPFAEGGFETPSGKCELRAHSLTALGLDPVPAYTPPVESRLGDRALRKKYPLELVSPKCADRVNSSFGNLPYGIGNDGRLEIHPRDAVPRGIADGDLVRVFNDRGSCRLIAAVGPTVATGAVCAEASPWNKRSRDHRNVNALTSERLTDMGSGPTFYSTLVEVERAGD